MLVNFFFELRQSGVPATVTEFLTLLEALRERVAWVSAQDFYYLARMCLVKDERHFDRFDRVFAETFAGAEKLFEQLVAQVPAEWLRALGERTLSEEEKRKIEALGGWNKLLETLRERLREQKERHEGGNKWIGTGGTSPFGANGYNPEGIRIGPQRSRDRAVSEGTPSGGEPSQLSIEESHVECRVVDHEFGIGDEGYELFRHFRELGFVVEVGALDAVHGHRALVNGALGIQIAMEGAAGHPPIHDLDAAYFNDSVTELGFEAGGFGIEDDLAHGRRVYIMPLRSTGAWGGRSRRALEQRAPK